MTSTNAVSRITSSIGVAEKGIFINGRLLRATDNDWEAGRKDMNGRLQVVASYILMTFDSILMCWILDLEERG